MEDELLSIRRALWGAMAVALFVIVIGVAGGELKSPFHGLVSSRPSAPALPPTPEPPPRPSPSATPCPTAGVSPPMRQGTSAAYDPDRRVMLLYGGWDSSAGPLSDTWTWDGACWKQVSDPAPPGPRREAAIAYDAVDHEVVLFGGEVPDTTGSTGAAPFQSDTWTWDGAWHKRNPGLSPQMLWATASDSPAGALLVGLDQNSHLMQTWTWKGGQWTQLSPAHEPTPRLGQTMAWSPRYQAALLYGGSSSAEGMLGDTWIWRGGDWNQISAGGSGPEARNNASLCLDARSGDLILIEGTLGVPQGDHAAHATTQWLWNGSSWEPSQPALPADRFYVVAVTDSDRGQIVAYSGAVFDPSSGQLHAPSSTWVWDGTAWSQR